MDIKAVLRVLGALLIFVGAVTRNGEVFVPVGNSSIEANDKVVIFALPKAVANVEKMFE